MNRLLLAALAPALLACAPVTASAAESYDNCTGFIDSVPATITTQGTWCLRKDLNTAMAVGEAIFIQANNVTIDCNNYKIGGLAAGASSHAQGILSWDKQNVTVRNCVVRGFYTGIHLHGGGGHAVEDNRVDNALYSGIVVEGENGMVRGNAVRDTGGASDQSSSYGIVAVADVIDNTVEGMFAVGQDTSPWAIMVALPGAEVRNNRVRGVVASGTGRAGGLLGNAAGITFVGNRVSSTSAVDGWGIIGGAQSFCTGNTISRYSTPIQYCQDVGGNASN